MLSLGETIRGLKWWNYDLKSSKGPSSNDRNRTWDWRRRRSSSILRVRRSCNLRSSRRLGTSICATMKPRPLSSSNSSRSSKSRSSFYMKNRWPNSSFWSKVIARILSKCVNRRRFSSALRTMTRQMLCAPWSSSKRLMRLMSWMKILRWLSSVRWKNWGKSINRVCRHFSSASRETVKSRLSTDRSTLKDSSKETKTCCKIFLRSRQWSKDAHSNSSSML